MNNEVDCNGLPDCTDTRSSSTDNGTGETGGDNSTDTTGTTGDGNGTTTNDGSSTEGLLENGCAQFYVGCKSGLSKKFNIINSKLL